MIWLTPSLKEDFALLRSRLRFDPADLDSVVAQRHQVILVASLIPGLRLCERRRLVVLAQAAPALELGQLSEAIERLDTTFNKFWPENPDIHELIISRTRAHLNDVYNFVVQLDDINRRRNEAKTIFMRLEEEVPFLRSSDPPFEPIFPYSGYEVTAILPALHSISYPDALDLRQRK